MTDEELRKRIDNALTVSLGRILATLKLKTPLSLQWEWETNGDRKRLYLFMATPIDPSRIQFKKNGQLGSVVLYPGKKPKTRWLTPAEQDTVLMWQDYIKGYDPIEHLKRIFEKYDKGEAA